LVRAIEREQTYRGEAMVPAAIFLPELPASIMLPQLLAIALVYWSIEFQRLKTLRAFSSIDVMSEEQTACRGESSDGGAVWPGGRARSDLFQGSGPHQQRSSHAHIHRGSQ
jgi:hypothetical protein